MSDYSGTDSISVFGDGTPSLPDPQLNDSFSAFGPIGPTLDQQTAAYNQATQAGSSASNFGQPTGAGFAPAGGANASPGTGGFIPNIPGGFESAAGLDSYGNPANFDVSGNPINSPAGPGIGNAGFSNNSQGGFINGLVGSAASIFGGVVQAQTASQIAQANAAKQQTTIRYVLIGALIIGGIYLLTHKK